MQVVKTLDDGGDHLVVPDEFLLQHRVHALLVEDGQALAHGVDVELAGQFLEHLQALVLDDVLGGGADAAADTGQQTQQQVALPLRVVDGRTNLRVVVHAEHLGLLVHGQLLDELHVALEGAVVRAVVHAGGRVLVVLIERLRLVEVLYDIFTFQDDRDEPAVLVVGDPAAVVGLGDHVVERGELDLLVLVQEDLELQHGDRQVGRGEFVGDVPTQRAELAALEHSGVEEGEAEEQLLPNLRLKTVLELLGVEGEVRAQQVVLEALRGLVGELDALL